MTVVSIFWEKKFSDYLYLSSFYLFIFLVFLVVAIVIAEVFYYSAVTVFINSSGSVTFTIFDDHFPLDA